MKFFCYSILIIIITVQSSFAQNWVFQTSNTDQNLWSVYFFDENTGLIVGEGGTILKTTDGGSSWLPRNATTANGLMVLQFVSPLIGYAAGLDGPLLKTIDAGESWNVIHFANQTQQKLGGGWFFNENNSVIALGDTNYDNSKILKTTNGGASWDTVYTTDGWISYFYFPDPDTGYGTASEGRIHKTTDGGTSWITQNTGSNLWMSGIYFFDGTNGFVGGGSWEPMGGTLYKTTNGGNTWQSILDGYAIAKIFFCDPTHGYALATDLTFGSGILLQTTNGGVDWSVFETPEDSLNGFHFINPNLGYAVGDKGRILKYSVETGVTYNNLIITDYYLFHNYPNPFNPVTTIRYSIPEKSHVTMTIYNITGQVVDVLVDQSKNPGYHTIQWDASSVGSGVYFYRIKAGDFTDVKKCLIIK